MTLLLLVACGLSREPGIYLPDCASAAFVEDEGGAVLARYRFLKAEVRATPSCIEPWLDRCYRTSVAADPFWKREADRPGNWPAYEPEQVWSSFFEGVDGKSVVQFERYDNRYLLYLFADDDVVCPQAEPRESIGLTRW